MINRLKFQFVFKRNAKCTHTLGQISNVPHMFSNQYANAPGNNSILNENFKKMNFWKVMMNII